MIYRHNRIYAQASDAVSILIVAPYKKVKLVRFSSLKMYQGYAK